MTNKLDVYEFRGPQFSPEGDTIVCVVERGAMEKYISKAEVSDAFSGCAVYRLRWPWNQYVGVWGKRNAARFRRFLEERGADVAIRREPVEGLKLFYWATRNERKRVRALPAD
jgi:hypothetical protein